MEVMILKSKYPELIGKIVHVDAYGNLLKFVYKHGFIIMNDAECMPVHISKLHDRTEYRVSRWVLKARQEMYKKSKNTLEENKKKAIENEIYRLKLAIREFEKRNRESKIVSDCGIDGYVELVELPYYITDVEDAEEYFRENIYIEPYRSMYDCTGKPFTAWYRLFRRHGKYMAYHRVAFDV